MKVYTLTIVFDDKTDEIEYIDEEMIEDTPTIMYNIQVDPDYYDDEILKRLIKDGLFGDGLIGAS